MGCTWRASGRCGMRSRMLVPLTLLAPDIVAAIPDGRQRDWMTLPVLMGPFPVEWRVQNATLSTSGTG